MRRVANRCWIQPKLIVTLSTNDLSEYMNGSNAMINHHDQFRMIQALNILLKHHSKESCGIASVGPSKISLVDAGATKCDLDRGLEAIRGYF